MLISPRSKFSIIVPTSLNPSGITRLLSSLSKVCYVKDDFEVLVIDNGSKRTCHKEFQFFKKNSNFFYFHTKKKGASVARNIGISRANFSLLVFLDDDVEVQPTILQAYAEAWNKYKVSSTPFFRQKVSKFIALPEVAWGHA